MNAFEQGNCKGAAPARKIPAAGRRRHWGGDLSNPGLLSHAIHHYRAEQGRSTKQAGEAHQPSHEPVPSSNLPNLLLLPFSLRFRFQPQLSQLLIPAASPPGCRAPAGGGCSLQPLPLSSPSPGLATRSRMSRRSAAGRGKGLLPEGGGQRPGGGKNCRTVIPASFGEADAALLPGPPPEQGFIRISDGRFVDDACNEYRFSGCDKHYALLTRCSHPPQPPPSPAVPPGLPCPAQVPTFPALCLHRPALDSCPAPCPPCPHARRWNAWRVLDSALSDPSHITQRFQQAQAARLNLMRFFIAGDEGGLVLATAPGAGRGREDRGAASGGWQPALHWGQLAA